MIIIDKEIARRSMPLTSEITTDEEQDDIANKLMKKLKKVQNDPKEQNVISLLESATNDMP